LCEIGGDYNDGDGNDKDDEFMDDWDNKDFENEGLDDDDDNELPDDWNNKNLDYSDLDDDDDDELPDDWNKEYTDNEDLDDNREKIYDDRFNEDKLNNNAHIETSRKTVIKAKNALHINSNEKFENELNKISKDKLKEPINTPINAGKRAGGNKKIDIPKKFCGLEPKDIMILHFLYDQNFENLEGREGITPLGKSIHLKENSLTGENLKHDKKGLNLQKIPQSQEEIKEVNNKLDLSEIPQSMEELNALGDYQNKNIVKNSIHRVMRMNPEQRERLGLSRGYTNHELNIFFAQNDPPSTLDINKAKPSKVSNPEGSESISRNDSIDGKSEGLKKESVNKTTVKEMTLESDIKQKETSSTLNKDIENSSSDVNKELEEQENLKEEKKEEKLKEKTEDLNNENSEDNSNREVLLEKTLLHPQLKLLYKEFNEEYENNGRKQNANHGILLRPAFREFVKNHENLTFEEKEELEKRIKYINSNKIIEKYILNQLKNTNFTENKIAEMEEIKGLKLVPDSVRRIVKDNKLNSREKLNFTRINIDLTTEIENLNENSFNDTLLHPKLLDLYKKYYEDEILNHKKYTANFGFFLRPAFIDFVKNQDNLEPSIKNDLLNRINIINSDRWIEKYIVYQLKKTSNTAFRIANMEDIEGLSMRLNAVKKKEKEYGLESREVVWKKNQLYDHFKKGTYLDVCKKIIEKAKSKINADRKVKGIELIKSNEAPTTKELINFNYEGLVCVVYNMGLSYNYNILKPLGYKLNHIISISDEKERDIKNTIISKNPFTSKDIAKKHKVSISTVLRIAKKVLGKEKYELRFSTDLPAEKGIITHKLVKNHITKVFDDRRKKTPDNPKIISEPKIYPESQKCTDLGFQNINHNKINYLQRLLTRTEQRDFFSQKLNIKLANLKDIKFVQFDFTSLLNEDNFLNKIEKYQHDEVLTFIIGTYWYKDWDDCIIELPNNKLIKFPDNIKIISPILFADLLDLQGEDRDKFLEIINLNEMNEIEALREMSEEEKINLNYTKELENDLKKNGQIKESINEFLNNKKKKSIKKGPLDKFILKEYRD